MGINSIAFRIVASVLVLMISVLSVAEDNRLERLQYNNPGLVVDLGVGL